MIAWKQIIVWKPYHSSKTINSNTSSSLGFETDRIYILLIIKTSDSSSDTSSDSS
jgi:hypothetical protein